LENLIFLFREKYYIKKSIFLNIIKNFLLGDKGREMIRMRLRDLPKYIFMPFFIGFLLFSYRTVSCTETISSPNGRIVVHCNIYEKPRPYPPGERIYYNIIYNGITIIQDSPLSLDLHDARSLESAFRFYHVARDNKNEIIHPVYGSRRFIRNHYNQIILSLQEKRAPFRVLKVVFRVSNDGVAFRYILPKGNDMSRFAITEEHSQFIFPDDYQAYALVLDSFSTNYENNIHVLPVSAILSRLKVGLPLLMDTGQNIWLAITEADLTGYAGMYLRGVDEHPIALESVLAPRNDIRSLKVIGSIPFHTPWRVVLISRSPGGLIESNFIFCLNDSCSFEDTSWIKPGKCVWPWWTDRYVEGVDFISGMNTATMLHYLNFAADHEIEYLLIDAGWYGNHQDRNEDITTPSPDVDLPLIIQQAKNRGVGIILWLFWECVEDQMDKAFPLYETWGVTGIKVDYMNRDDQEMIDFYHDVIEKAAQHHLIVNFHGAYKPTGIRRTYPNLITREGVLGLEYSKWSDRCDPEHELILPFTRMLAGPMDFTPGSFRTVMKENFDPQALPPVAMGTRCHQLAMYVIYESPLQMCVDYPASYQNQPSIEFLKAVPTTWDDTRVLNAGVGDYITIARRYGEEWFIGAMTDWTPRALTIPLSFLGEGHFSAEIYSDKIDSMIDPTGVDIVERAITASDSLYIGMGPGGGYVARVRPVELE